MVFLGYSVLQHKHTQIQQIPSTLHGFLMIFVEVHWPRIHVLKVISKQQCSGNSVFFPFYHVTDPCDKHVDLYTYIFFWSSACKSGCLDFSFLLCYCNVQTFSVLLHCANIFKFLRLSNATETDEHHEIKQIEGFRPEWFVSSMLYSRDIPLWPGTLEILLHVSATQVNIFQKHIYF